MNLKETPEGCAFNGRRIRQLGTGEFLVDMQKFVQERLYEVPLEKGRASLKKELANPAEVDGARATCGALNWLAKEGRPDLAGESSLMSSRLASLTIEDVCNLNAVVKQAKEEAELTIRIQPLQRMRFGVVSDASWGNAGFHSQGGHIIISHEKELHEAGQAKANVIAWRSGKL